MNWVTSLFKRIGRNKLRDTPAVSTQGTKVHVAEKAATNLNASMECSAPSFISVDKLTKLQTNTLVPLRHLDEYALSTLSYQIVNYTKTLVLFVLGEPAESVYYLLEGTVTLLPNGKEHYQISANSTRAHLPINSGNTFGATAVATTDVKILTVQADLTQLWTAKSKEDMSCIELVDISLPEPLQKNKFFHSFAAAYRENRLHLPSLPDVALKLKEAMSQDIGVPEAVEIIQMDAAVVTKLIQVANSPLYTPISPIKNCQDAVTRLGLSATRNLVMSISLKQLFMCKDKKLMTAMQKLWRRSLYISSLSFILAEEMGEVSPDDALLAGLVSDIGVIPLLYFAEQYPDIYPDVDELEAAMPYLRAPVGSLMLHTLGLPEELTHIPHYSEDWHYDSGDQISVIDIVILAKLHSYFGSQQATNLPYINTIPAYSKLKEGKLTPDFSLSLLQRANQRIKTAMSILS